MIVLFAQPQWGTREERTPGTRVRSSLRLAVSKAVSSSYAKPVCPEGVPEGLKLIFRQTPPPLFLKSPVP